MRVFCNVAISADGKIGPPTRTHMSFGSPEDRRRMSLLRRQADAVVTGGATFRACPFAMVENAAHLPDAPQRAVPVLNAVVTHTGVLAWEAPCLKDPRIRMVVITSGSGAEVAQAHAPAGVEVVVLEEVTAPGVLEVLATRGAQSVLLESGGGLSSLFFHAGVVNELYLTVVPILLGGAHAPTPLDGPAWPLDQAPRLDLVDVSVVGAEAFFHYRVQAR